MTCTNESCSALTVVCHARRVPLTVWKRTSDAVSPPVNVVVCAESPASMPSTGMSVASSWVLAVASAWEASMPGEAEGTDSPLTGDPRTLIKRPSLVTFAFRPLPNSGKPDAYCTQLRWCVPPMST
jgi:hypothetical protein